VARRFVAGGPFWTALRVRRTGQRRRLLPGKRGARRYLRQSVLVEAAHGTSFLALLAVTLAEWRAGRVASGTLWLIGNVVINGYPVLVQRYNRRGSRGYSLARATGELPAAQRIVGSCQGRAALQPRAEPSPAACS
jgi:hypothetical protein